MTAHFPPRIDVVLPAGGRISGAFAQEAGTEIKTLISLGGQTVLRRVIQAFRQTGIAGRIVVIGPNEVQAEALSAGADAVLEEGATGPENLYRGMQWLQQNASPAPRVCISTTDLPFLTADAITQFLAGCPAEADVTVPVITKQALEARFPGCANVFVPLRGGPITTGCVYLVNPTVLLRNRSHIEAIFNARKSQWQMARLVGGRIAFRLLTRRLTIEDVALRAGQILQCKGAAVLDAPPEVAFDIDLPGEFEYARSAYALT